MAFVMVLSWSRKIFLRFYLNAQMASFLRGHVEAFAAWQGFPKVLLYDNTTTTFTGTALEQRQTRAF